VHVSQRDSYQVIGSRSPSRAPSLPKWWLWPNLLSLDAPAVALVWQLLFVRSFHGQFSTPTAILLVTSVWLIYAADRALDAWGGDCSSARHRFYHAHGRLLIPLWMMVFAGSAWLAFTRLPAALLWRGLILLAAVLIYFLAVHGWKSSPQRVLSGKDTLSRDALSKEASVGLLFALGVSLAAWSNIQTLFDVLGIGLFFVLCWINCAAIQKWESSSSASWNWSAVADAPADWPVLWLALGVAVPAGFLAWFHRPILGAAEMASALVLIWLDRKGHRFSPDALRVLADVALLSPVLFLPLAGRV
jgi:hypothetical protein